MKYCPNCKKQFSEDERFCPEDGTPLQPAATSVVTERGPEVIVERPSPQPVQIIQMAPARSRTGLYIALGLITCVAMVIAFILWIAHDQTRKEQEQETRAEQQAQQATEEYTKDRLQQIGVAKLKEPNVKQALDNVFTGTLATYRGCAEVKMNLYVQRYNKWLERQEEIPSPSHTQQSLSLAAQASLNSCRKETEALENGVPSFNCNTSNSSTSNTLFNDTPNSGNTSKPLTPTETTICANKELAQLDVMYSNATRAARFFTTDTEKFNAFVRTGMKNRDNCDTNIECITNTYKSMTSTLNSQIEP